MNYLLGLFINNILPIFLASAAGYLIARYLHVNPRPISQVAFNIFSPCLAFDLLAVNQLKNQDVFRLLGFVLTVTFLIALLTWLIGKWLKFERPMLFALLLVTVFGNLGNYGLSLNQFAFGDPAMPYASLCFVISLVLIYTLGVVFASVGRQGLRKALLGLVRVPALYTALLALIFNQFGWRLPLPLDRTVSLLSSATVPTLIVLLGMQLHQTQLNGQYLALGLANLIRLVFSPLLALGLGLLFGLRGPAYQAGVIQSSMPTAVLMTVLASEYNLEPAFVSSAVFTTTLISPLTLTPLLAYLGA